MLGSGAVHQGEGRGGGSVNQPPASKNSGSFAPVSRPVRGEDRRIDVGHGERGGRPESLGEALGYTR